MKVSPDQARSRVAAIVSANAFAASGCQSALKNCTPKHTIGMLACWAADAIKENYVRSPGALV
ncbi:MAG TPA: hypothetical protein VGM42_05645 [Rhodopila sp.]